MDNRLVTLPELSLAMRQALADQRSAPQASRRIWDENIRPMLVELNESGDAAVAVNA